ncbi:MAG: hypothetical protein EOO77_45950 [Oxalobacteraceae bacterium]|nr:MAG: hypothetical protein EOO77_45950 [Oxalobacteraceae bacterium]
MHQATGDAYVMLDAERPFCMPYLHGPIAQALATTKFETVFAYTAFGILPASAQAGVALALATNRSPTPLLWHRDTIRKLHFRAT